MSYQGVISSMESGNNPGLCPVEGQQPGLSSWTRKRYQFWSLSLSTDKTPPHSHMLVVQLAFYFFYYILPRDPQGWFRFYKLVNSSLSTISFPYTLWGSKSPTECQVDMSTPFGTVVCTNGDSVGSLKGFQSHLIVRANTNVFLWCNIHMNFKYRPREHIFRPGKQ